MIHSLENKGFEGFTFARSRPCYVAGTVQHAESERPVVTLVAANGATVSGQAIPKSGAWKAYAPASHSPFSVIAVDRARRMYPAAISHVSGIFSEASE